MIELYSWYTSNGRKVSIALEELGLPYEIHPIDITRGEQTTIEFMRVSPNGKIPAIVDQDAGGRTLMESGAILLYLADKMGRLISKDEDQRWRTIEWLMWQIWHHRPHLLQHPRHRRWQCFSRLPHWDHQHPRHILRQDFDTHLCLFQPHPSQRSPDNHWDREPVGGSNRHLIPQPMPKEVRSVSQNKLKVPSRTPTQVVSMWISELIAANPLYTRLTFADTESRIDPIQLRPSGYDVDFHQRPNGKTSDTDTGACGQFTRGKIRLVSLVHSIVVALEMG